MLIMVDIDVDMISCQISSLKMSYLIEKDINTDGISSFFNLKNNLTK